MCNIHVSPTPVQVPPRSDDSLDSAGLNPTTNRVEPEKTTGQSDRVDTRYVSVGDAQTFNNTDILHNDRPIYLHEDDSLSASEGAAGRLYDLPDDEFFTRLETAKQGKLSKADGKMGRADLRAALKNGGLSPEETAIAEYLLNNFDQIASGRFIRADDLRAHAAAIELSAQADVPLAGLQSFVDDRDASSFFGLLRHDKDFRNLANGSSISQDELERGLTDADFTQAQQAAIAFMLQNLDAVGGEDGRIQAQELRTLVNTLGQARVNQSIEPHRANLAAFLANNALFKSMSDGNLFGRTITQASLERALSSEQFNASQKQTLGFLQDNFDIIARADDGISKNDLSTALQNDFAKLEAALFDGVNANAARQAMMPAWRDPAQLDAFIHKVDALFHGDDRGHRFGFISLDKGAPGYAPFDDRSAFSEPFSLFGSKKAPTDGYVSRNDLQRALTAETLSSDEHALASILLNNFAEIGNHKSTIHAEQVRAFLEDFTRANVI